MCARAYRYNTYLAISTYATICDDGAELPRLGDNRR